MSNSDVDEDDVEDLEINSIIGFDGTTINGFWVHPDGKHVIYPLGNKVAILDWYSRKQNFLSGHTNIISAVALSKYGKYVASGQINHIGFKAMVIIWDFEKRTILYRHELHKVRVEAVAFSQDEQFCMSLGGRDCGCVVVWDMVGGEALCGAEVSRGVQGDATTLVAMHQRGACFMTAGDCLLAAWWINRQARNVKCADVNCAKLKRNVLCIDVNERDEVAYCGTTTGDLLKVRLNFHHDTEILEPTKTPIVIGCFAKIPKKKVQKGGGGVGSRVELYSQGIRAVKIYNKLLLIGAGDGTVDMVDECKITNAPKKMPSYGIIMPSTPSLRVLRTTTVHTAITSIQWAHQTNTILIATKLSEIYAVDLKSFEPKLVITCHVSAIYDIVFPHKLSDVFATAGRNDVRVWSMRTMQELLRIRVPNFNCSSVLFSYDGKSILTGWDDGVIRSFTPITGRLIYAILNGHNKGVAALAITKRGERLLSGGCEGQVRVWSICPIRQELVCTLKEHKAPISSLQLNHNDDEAVSASTDGTCIIWDLVRLCRRQILFANTTFMCARYYPNSSVQILTGGSDRKLAYWEALDGVLVRELEGSQSGGINSLDIGEDGAFFVTASNDQMVKLWRYQEGVPTHIGIGHSAVVTAVKFSPDGRYIVSVSASGSIFIWRCPAIVREQVSAVGKKISHTNNNYSRNRNTENIEDLQSVKNHNT